MVPGSRKLGNYISNAIKYGGNPPRVVLGSTPLDDGMVCFWVRDNGEGIPPVKHDLLFNQFSRLNESLGQGHGLGLSIVRRIVERLGGEVSFDSVLGQGSEFSFTLLVSFTSLVLPSTARLPDR